MTVKELIIKLLEYHMDSEVQLVICKDNGDIHGYAFDIEKVDQWGSWVELVFTDWREEENE